MKNKKLENLIEELNREQRLTGTALPGGFIVQPLSDVFNQLETRKRKANRLSLKESMQAVTR